MKWKGKLINYIIEKLKDDSIWGNIVEQLVSDSTIGIHLAVLNEPFLSLILDGEKKYESRFSINRISPFEKVKKGDIVILKKSAGLIIGVFVAGDVFFYHNINQILLKKIEDDFGELICSTHDKDFWGKKDKAKFASLIEVKNVIKLPPFKSEKKDRSGWSVLREGNLITYLIKQNGTKINHHD